VRTSFAQGLAVIPTALRQSQAARPGASVVGDNFWLATDRLTT
jgi:hypothetical protein